MPYDSTDFHIEALPAPVVDPKSLTTPRERLIYLRDFLRNLPREKFNMIGWIVGGRRRAQAMSHKCGTTCCIGGWAAVLFGTKNIDGVAAQNLLGLNDTQATQLFYGMGMRNYKLYYDLTNSQAANIIDHLINTGEVDWSKA